ncbi:MAG: hypothetical protein GY757_28705, partial [bacterium]|nr:hypothetical protein [bacterium]
VSHVIIQLVNELQRIITQPAPHLIIRHHQLFCDFYVRASGSRYQEEKFREKYRYRLEMVSSDTG